MIYSLYNDIVTGQLANFVKREDNVHIPFDVANTDYAKFKEDLANGVELEDADGNTMSAEAAAEFLKTLP